MTYKTFAAIAAAYRPDVEVTRHNGFQEQSGVGVVFRQSNSRTEGSNAQAVNTDVSTDRCNDDRTGGRRIYRYKGSYSDILNRLGIKVVTREDYESTRWLLRQAREQHGKASLFSGKPQDRSREIAGYEELLRRFESDEYVREWEFASTLSDACSHPTEG